MNIQDEKQILAEHIGWFERIREENDKRYADIIHRLHMRLSELEEEEPDDNVGNLIEADEIEKEVDRAIKSVDEVSDRLKKFL